MVKINRNYKDRLFRLIFCEKKDLLELYNAITGSSYENPDELEIVTLNDVIYIGMKNDLAFILDEILNLWEHQSSWNPNMPLRGLFYFADEYRKYIEMNHLNIYGSSLITIPTPQYVIFYNGTHETPDRLEIPLSQAFLPKRPDLTPCVEVKAALININRGRNRELMKHCRKLHHYSEFIGRIRDGLADGLSLTDATQSAIDSCIKDGILAEFLSIHRAEVNHVILTEYDEQQHLAGERELGVTLGCLMVHIQWLRKKFEKHLTVETAAEELELDKAYVTQIYTLLREHGELDDRRLMELLAHELRYI